MFMPRTATYIGGLISKARKKMDRDVVATRLDVSGQQVNNIEAGRSGLDERKYPILADLCGLDEKEIRIRRAAEIIEVEKGIPLKEFIAFFQHDEHFLAS